MAFETHGIFRLQKDLVDFRVKIEDIDIEEAKKNFMVDVAVEMTKMVIKALKAESRINTPATDGPYESGRGPSISTREAWMVNRMGDGSYRLSPHPLVRQRAIVLNDGWGPITPDGDKPMRFTVNSVPVFAEEVDGPERTEYWQAAFNMLISSGKVDEIQKDAVEEEVDEST